MSNTKLKTDYNILFTKGAKRHPLLWTVSGLGLGTSAHIVDLLNGGGGKNFFLNTPDELIEECVEDMQALLAAHKEAVADLECYLELLTAA